MPGSLSKKTPTEIDSLKELASSIVLAQGNIFIKELLRKHHVRIGTTKAEFLQSMYSAIDSGTLRREHFNTWLDEVEGWGDQHVYLYVIKNSRRLASQLHNAGLAKKAVIAAGFGKLWATPSSLLFPAKRQLVSIVCDEDSLRFTWHEGYESWVRKREQDFESTIDADYYQYRAYLRLAERSVMRFEWPIDKSYAALFVQVPWDHNEHGRAKNEVWPVIAKFLPIDNLIEVDISAVIKNIDQSSLAGNTNTHVAAQSTRLRTPGASVDFSSTILDQSYARSEAVRRVRRAVQLSTFSGDMGVFVFKPSNSLAISRDTKIQMYGESNRVKFWAQCPKLDVWNVLDELIAASE